jgi:hypothetical protein
LFKSVFVGLNFVLENDLSSLKTSSLASFIASLISLYRMAILGLNSSFIASSFSSSVALNLSKISPAAL